MGGAYDKPHRQECRPKKALLPPPSPSHCPHLRLDDSPILLMGRLAPPLLSCWVFAQQRTRVSFENRAFKRLWVSLKAGFEDCLWDLLLFPLPSALFSPPGLPSSLSLFQLHWPPCCSRQLHCVLALLRVPPQPTEFTHPFLTPPLGHVM